eukprot:scaffold97498_cov36-Phaeocystis_antarctica.AAC.1
MGKPSSQQVFWHSFFFLRSLLHCFLHEGCFFLHFLVLILHVLSSLRPRQSSGCGGDGDGGDGGGGGAGEGGGGGAGEGGGGGGAGEGGGGGG